MSNIRITQEHVNNILSKSKIEVETWGGKTTIVKCVLPNGFIIVDSSSCVDPTNYDEELGKQIVLDRIENKVWELEGYVLQNQIN